jgi:hypothetical protein
MADPVSKNSFGELMEVYRKLGSRSPDQRANRKSGFWDQDVLLSGLTGVTVKVLRSTADLYGEIRFNLHLAPRTIIDM